jgi:hypothetical protein
MRKARPPRVQAGPGPCAASVRAGAGAGAGVGTGTSAGTGTRGAEGPPVRLGAWGGPRQASIQHPNVKLTEGESSTYRERIGARGAMKASIAGLFTIFAVAAATIEPRTKINFPEEDKGSKLSKA